MKTENIAFNAKKNFQSLLFPTTKDENYRFSSLKEHESFFKERAHAYEQNNFKKRNSTEVSESVLPSFTQMATLSLDSNQKLEIRWTEAQKKEIQDKNISIELLSPSLEKLPSFFNDYKTPHSLEKDYITQFCLAYADLILFIHIPEKCELSFPLLWITHPFEKNFILNKFILIEKGSKLFWIDKNTSPAPASTANEKNYHCSFDHFIVKEQSHLDVLEIDSSSHTWNRFSRTALEISAHSKIHHTLSFSGGHKIQKRVESTCLQSHSSYLFNGIFAGAQKQNFDLWINSNHNVPHTQSSVEFSSILTDSAQSVFNGALTIAETATNTEAHQKNKNILLSKNAHAISLPKLMISTDEVKCSHGATVSTLDPEQIYYLESRGIDKKHAELIILEGFFDKNFKIEESIIPPELKEELKYEFLKKFHPSLQENPLLMETLPL